MPKGIPLTQEEQAARRREIFDASVSLFIEKGFQNVTMRQIAAAAGMGKSTLYDYFQDKDEILVFVLVEMTLSLTQHARDIAGMDLPPDARLQRIMDEHLKFMQSNRYLFARLTNDLQTLRPDSQQRINEKRYVYQDLVASIIQEGIDRGCFRPVDPLLAARLLLNSMLSVLFSTRPAGSPEERLTEAISIFLDGIKTSRS